MTVTYLNNIAFADVFVLYSYVVCASLCFRNNIIACAESLLQPRHCATYFTWFSSFNSYNNSEIGPITLMLPVS